MFKRGKLSWLIWNLILATLLIGFSIASLVQNKNGDFQSAIVLIAGIVVILDASIRLLLQVITVINYGKKDILVHIRGGAIASSLELAVGISTAHLASLIRSDIGQAAFLFRFIGDFVGIAAIVVGAFIIIYGTILAIKKTTKVIDTIFNYVGAALFITGGILILVFLRDNPSAIMSAFFITLGIVGLILGLILALGSFVIYRFAKKAEAQLQILANAQEASEKPEEEKPEEEKKEE